MSTRRIGSSAEDSACRFLQSQGLSLIQANYYCRVGEIDLIMQDEAHGIRANKSLVFVEVRYRKRPDFGSPAASVQKYKQKRIIKAAKHYLVSCGKYDKMACRFDIVALSGENHENNIEWIKNAFETTN